MTALFHIAVINAVTVLPLAVLAFLVGRLARRPALTHALWVLVLLKFVTPPLFNLPVTIEIPVAAEAPVGSADVGHVSNVPAPMSDSSPLENTLTVSQAVHPVKSSPSDMLPSAPTEPRHVGREESSFFTSALKTCSTYWARRPDLRSALLAGWLAGAALWMTWQIGRAIRFQRRVLRGAVASDEVQEQTQELAVKLGLRRSPQVLIVDAAVSPMLWGCGSRARLLFPSDLAARLDDNARATLLTHELAHFSRGDHWVRLLELIATGLFWWHPVVWWARQQIEESEEECCDACVVGQFPNAPRQYAEALLDTIDFLCESRQALPPVACGLGQAHFLRHRLTKIMRGAAPKALSQRIRFVIALIAALVLPLQPFVFGSASLSQTRIETLPVNESHSDPTTAQRTEVRDQGSEQEVNRSSSPTANAAAPAAKRGIRGERVWSTATSPDGRFVVRAIIPRRVVLTDLSANSETDLSDQQITAVAFAPHGEWFAAAGQDGRVTIWDSARGELLRTVLIHTDVLRSVAVSPRANVIAAGSRDGTVLMVDLLTGEALNNLPTYPSAVNCVRFSSDGRQLAVAVG
ncbi:MAG: hypothetical protein IAG10_29385, partial [Planctomycetaceae bacterium]|nr:hypothetical protein [Planctomycetaceae bacterium]